MVKPPGFVVELGLLAADDRWYVRKALYGLPTSPRDWGDYRDSVFRTFAVEKDGVSHGLFQSKSDESLWLLRTVGADGAGAIVGLVVVYVDDLAIFSTPELCAGLIEQIQLKWKTSEPSWLQEGPVTFCGAEITRGERGYVLTQVSYIRELLQRYGSENTSPVPISKWVEPEAEGTPDPGLVIKRLKGLQGLYFGSRRDPVPTSPTRYHEWVSKPLKSRSSASPLGSRSFNIWLPPCILVLSTYLTPAPTSPDMVIWRCHARTMCWKCTQTPATHRPVGGRFSRCSSCGEVLLSHGRVPGSLSQH